MKRYRLALTVLLALLFCMPVSPCALAAEAGEGVKEYSVSFSDFSQMAENEKMEKIVTDSNGNIAIVGIERVIDGRSCYSAGSTWRVWFIMTLALAVPAFAVTDPTIPSDTSDEDYGIMPLASLFPQTPIAGAGTYKTYDFTASSSNGNYIRFWFENTTSEAVDVYLYRTDSGKDKLVKSMSVDGDSHNQEVYYNSTASSGTYYIKIDASESGGTISGNLSVAQYTKRPN